MKKSIYTMTMATLLLVNISTYADCPQSHEKIMHRLFFDGFPGGHMEVIDEVFHPEFELNHPVLPPGIEGVKTIVKMNNDAFDGWHFEIHDLICDGDKIVARYTGSGVHVNSFMGETPTNKEVHLDGISIFVIKDNRIIKDWYMPDDLGFQRQLGLIPPAPH